MIHGIEAESGLHAYAAYHLREKARTGRTTHGWLSQTQRQLEAAVRFFGPDRDLSSITVADVQAYAGYLRELPNGRGGFLSGQSQRHYLNSLSNLYRRASSEGYVLPGYNPVAAMLEKPTVSREEARWLEGYEAALLLEAMRTYRAPAKEGVFQYMYPLVATFLLTGGRRMEVFGLEVDDLSFQRKTITFRPNRWRRLKTERSRRVVPLWPQLEEILRAYIIEREREDPLGSLLFPSARPGANAEAMIHNIRKALDRIGPRAGWKPGEIRSKMFRHT